jgi:hypothetical protein
MQYDLVQRTFRMDGAHQQFHIRPRHAKIEQLGCKFRLQFHEQLYETEFKRSRFSNSSLPVFAGAVHVHNFISQVFFLCNHAAQSCCLIGQGGW